MKTLLTAQMTIGAMVAGPAGAQVSCTEWNAPKFFRPAKGWMSRDAWRPGPTWKHDLPEIHRCTLRR